MYKAGRDGEKFTGFYDSFLISHIFELNIPFRLTEGSLLYTRAGSVSLNNAGSVTLESYGDLISSLFTGGSKSYSYCFPQNFGSFIHWHENPDFIGSGGKSAR